MDAALGVDVGGTFTDAVLLVDGTLTTAKVPTTEDRSRGVVEAVEAVGERAGVDPAEADRFRHATTTAVNAMLEGTGAETALVTTDGFRDVLAIGRQDRPALYDLSAEKPTPLVPRERRHEVAERATTDGIERSVDPTAVRNLAAAIDEDVEAVAVCLLHAYAHPENERRVARILREELGVPVSASHEVLAAFREYERTATTVADATVTPVIDDYLGRLEERAAERNLPAPRVMQSNGGIADAATVREHAVTTVLSGPAAGVVGAGILADALVTFDMGGTSTDVSLVREGAAERTDEADVAGHPVRVPMVDVNTVGAGGGSVGRVDAGGALRVGPDSAGAVPGPACYGRGGTEPTVTDAALRLGYLGAGAELGAGGEVVLDADAATAALADLAAAADLAGADAAAAGVHRVAIAAMARAVRAVTTERGHDPRGFALAAFGGAGPMFAAALADRLGMDRALVPRASGVLSALGLLAADESHDAVRTRRTPLARADPDAVEAEYDDLRERVLADASDPDAATVERGADCRYEGQGFELTVGVGAPFDPAAVRAAFRETHERAYGYRLDEPVELVSLRATATIPADPPPLDHAGESVAAASRGERPARFGFDDGSGTEHETAVYDWRRLPVDATVAGPAIVKGGGSTVVVPPGWRATVDDQGTLVLEGADE